jgi:hypothetical protein
VETVREVNIPSRKNSPLIRLAELIVPALLGTMLSHYRYKPLKELQKTIAERFKFFRCYKMIVLSLSTVPVSRSGKLD